MIDPKTGEVILADSLRLKPSMTLESFLASRLSATAKSVVVSNVERSYVTSPEIISGKPFSITLFFHQARLTMVELSYIGNLDENEDPWRNWSEQRELERKKFHDRWLRTVFGHGALIYSWGNVSSIYDPKSGASTIVVRYSRKSKDTRPISES